MRATLSTAVHVALTLGAVSGLMPVAMGFVCWHGKLAVLQLYVRARARCRYLAARAGPQSEVASPCRGGPGE